MKGPRARAGNWTRASRRKGQGPGHGERRLSGKAPGARVQGCSSGVQAVLTPQRGTLAPTSALPNPWAKAARPSLAPDSGPRHLLQSRDLEPAQSRLRSSGLRPRGAVGWPGLGGRGVPGAKSYFYKLRQPAGEEEPAPGPIVWARRGRGTPKKIPSAPKGAKTAHRAEQSTPEPRQ